MPMKPLVRKIYFWTIAVLFLISTPLLLARGMGYVWDPEHFQWTQTGSLSIESLPTGASITLDGKTLTQTTPTLINRLSPGQHTVTISKSLYRSMSKTITVDPQRTTLLPQITLLLEQNNKNTLLSGNIFSTAIIDHRHQRIALIEQTNGKQVLWLINNGQAEQVWSSDELVVEGSLSWSKNNQWIGLLTSEGAKEHLHLISVNPDIPSLVFPSSKNSPLLTQDSVQNWQWSPTDDLAVYIQTGSHLDKYYFESKTLLPVWALPDLSWRFIGNEILIPKIKSVEVATTIDDSKPLIPYDGPSVDLYAESQTNLLILRKRQDATLLFYKRKESDVQRLSWPATIQNGAWSSQQNRLLVWSDYEIWLADHEQEELTLQLRGSSPISAVHWMESERGFFYQDSNGIHAILYDRPFEAKDPITVIASPNVVLVGCSDHDRNLITLEREQDGTTSLNLRPIQDR